MRYLFIIPLFFSVTLFAQSSKNEKIIPTYLRPQFNDTNLLFFNDSAIWECHYKNDSPLTYYPLSEVSFETVDTCKCYWEIYQKIQKNVYDAATYAAINKIQIGSLNRINTSDFIYQELDKNLNVIKSDTLIFDFFNIAKTESIFTEDDCGDPTKLKVFRYFKTTKK